MPTKLMIVMLAAALPCLCCPMAHAQPSDVAVVVSNANQITALTKSDLRKILTGEKHSWPGGTAIKLFIRAPGAHERSVFLKIMGISESEYRQYWTGQVFRGEAQSEPVALFSNGMQKEALTAYPGAIALIDMQDLKPGMKVIKIDGCLPGEPRYSIR
jgi:ABC-type phosphate transport system substrate-binding protein